VRNLKQHNAMALSAALSFRTIFALVPLIILAFLILKAVGVVEDSKRTVRQLLEEGGLAQIVYSQAAESAAGKAGEQQAAPPPEGKITVADKVEAAIDHLESQLTVGRLGPIGVVLLVWTALTLLMTMERSLNRIFEAPAQRPLAQRVIIYWGVVTLGPLVLAATAYAGGKAVAFVSDLPVLWWVVGAAGWLVPVLVGVAFAAGVYMLMPNTHVRLKAALAGAMAAVPLWMAARWGFSLYVEHVGKNSLYGAIGLIPLFLVWLNLSWLIFLLGGQVTYTAGNPRRFRRSAESDRLLGPWDVLAAAAAVAQGAIEGGGPVPAGAVADRLGLAEDAAQRLLARLSSRGIICQVAGDGPAAYVLACAAGRIAVGDVLAAADVPAAAAPQGAGAEVIAAVARVRRRAQAGIEGLTLAAVLAEK